MTLPRRSSNHWAAQPCLNPSVGALVSGRRGGRSWLGAGVGRRPGSAGRRRGRGYRRCRADPTSSQQVSRLELLCGVAGPVATVTTYAVAGARTPGHDLLTQSLSQLSRLGAPERPLAVAGLLATGVALLGAAPVLAPRARPAMVAAGLASLGAAAFPLDGSREAFRVHAVWVVLGYVALGLVPVLHERRPTSYAVTGLAGAALGLTLSPAVSGVAQRVGLIALLGWLLATCVRGPARR